MGKHIEPIKHQHQINCQAPCGDWTGNVQTKATQPAANCPVHLFHTTETVQKRQFQWQGHGSTGQLTTNLKWRGVNFNTCVNFGPCPVSGDKEILYFYIYYALAQRKAYNPSSLGCMQLPVPINSLWPSDAIWRQGSRSTLVQVMACCLTAPTPLPEPIITKIWWCSSEGNFASDITAISHKN